MNDETKEQMRFVLDDDSELMRAALAPDSDLDEENKQMNRELTTRHEQILAKLDPDELLSQEDLQLTRDANEIHGNDSENLNGRHKEAMALQDWLDKNPKTPTRAEHRARSDAVKWCVNRQVYIGGPSQVSRR